MTDSLLAGELAETLSTTLREMQHINNRKIFAICHPCRLDEHHVKGSICALTDEPLSVRNVNLIWKEVKSFVD